MPDLKVSPEVQTFPPSLPPSLPCPPTCQIRAVNRFVLGDWSNAIEVSISLDRLPRPSNVREIEVNSTTAIRDLNQQTTVTVSLYATWSLPEIINGNLTGYDAYIGLSPLPVDLYATNQDSLVITMEFTVIGLGFRELQQQSAFTPSPLSQPENTEGQVNVVLEDIVEDTVLVYYQVSP